MQSTFNSINKTIHPKALNFKSTYQVCHHVLNRNNNMFERVTADNQNKILNKLIIRTVNSKSKENPACISGLTKVLREFFSRNDSCCSLFKIIMRSFSNCDGTFFISGQRDCDRFTQQAAMPIGITKRQHNIAKKEYEEFLKRYNDLYANAPDTPQKKAAAELLEKLLYKFKLAETNYIAAQKHYYEYGNNYTHNDNLSLKNSEGKRLSLCTAFVEDEQQNGAISYKFYCCQFMPENDIEKFQNKVNSELNKEKNV